MTPDFYQVAVGISMTASVLTTTLVGLLSSQWLTMRTAGIRYKPLAHLVALGFLHAILLVSTAAGLVALIRLDALWERDILIAGLFAVLVTAPILGATVISITSLRGR